MSRWSPDVSPGRQRRQHAFSTGYSVFVRITKFVLPIAALTIIGIVMAQLSEDTAEQITQTPKQEETTPGQIELVAARYEGTDDRGRPYTLIAERANRAVNAPDRVLLDDVKADITMEDETWIAVMADKGIYDTKAAQLDLSGNVAVHHDTGYEMHMQTIDINLKTRQAQTDKPVRAQGPLGALKARNMTILDAGARIIFAGPATLTFFNLSGRE